MRGVVVTLVIVAGLAGCSSDDEPTSTDDAAEVSTTAVSDSDGNDVTVPTTSDSTTSATTKEPIVPAVTDPVPDPTTDPATGTVPADLVTPVGFDLVQATVTTADGEVCEVCLWMADSSRLRAQGLMGVTDLGVGDGMAFVYDGPHTGTFWMKDTLLPLSIAFFDEDGAYLDSFDMEPCEADPCPVYPTAPQFLVAIETTQGDLNELGIGDGSRLDLTTLPCTAGEG